MPEYSRPTVSEKLIDKIISLKDDMYYTLDIAEISNAIECARKYHGSQVRDDGEPYYHHPIEVASMFIEYTAKERPEYCTTDMIITAILHDTIEDTRLTKQTIGRIFNPEIAINVEKLSRNKSSGKITAAETAERLYAEKDYGVLMVKIFDRYHNLTTIEHRKPKQIKETIKETLDTFIDIANNIGLDAIAENMMKIINQYN